MSSKFHIKAVCVKKITIKNSGVKILTYKSKILQTERDFKTMIFYKCGFDFCLHIKYLKFLISYTNCNTSHIYVAIFQFIKVVIKGFLTVTHIV